jgi:pheromone a factor receptor
MQLMTSSQGLNRGRYIRLMALASIEILGTIPIGTYILVSNSGGVTPYRWASVHSHYSEVYQIPSVVWKNNSTWTTGLEMFRWLLVACAFIFFAFFGFADDARQHYRLVYTSLARRLGYPTSTLRGSSHVPVCVVHLLYSYSQTH